MSMPAYCLGHYLARRSLRPLTLWWEVFDHKHYYSKHDLAYIAAQAGLHLAYYGTFELGGNSVAVLISQ